MPGQDFSLRECALKLGNGSLRTDALNDLKQLLSSTALQSEANKSIETNVGLGKILECLDTTEPSEFTLACEVLQLYFSTLPLGHVVNNYTINLMYLLRHEKACLRQIAVDEVYKVMVTDTKLLPGKEHRAVFVAISQLVGDPEVAIASKAIYITSHLEMDIYPHVLEEMKIVLQGNTSSKCNVFEVIVNLSSKNPELLQLCSKEGYIDFMLTELQSFDILYQLNIIELLTRLAVTPHGIAYLVEQGFLNRISDLIANLNNNPLGNLLTPGYMKFFGAIAHLYPREIIENYPIITDSLFETIESDDRNILPVALDTLGFVGTTLEGKLSLASLGHKFTSSLTRVGELIRNSPTEIKVRALFTMSALIAYDKDPKAPKTGPIDHRVTLMTREWFRGISERPPPMELLFGLCKNPFPDVKLAAFSLLEASCQHQWGEELVARTPGFIEFLLDRSLDHTKEAKEAKYDVIKRLARSAAFDPNILLRLTEYLEQGPFYAESGLAVAMEEGD